ncbi:MAG TPA: hypothetical protein VK760_12565 [Candidatus Acidoferrales bacterium]|nr:hypothetical protein [Candidatus Acidoferrales bacterium]
MKYLGALALLACTLAATAGAARAADKEYIITARPLVAACKPGDVCAQVTTPMRGLCTFWNMEGQGGGVETLLIVPTVVEHNRTLLLQWINPTNALIRMPARVYAEELCS